MLLQRSHALLLATVAVLVGGTLGIAGSTSPRKSVADETRTPHGRIVFVMATGLEDSEEMTSAVQDAKLAKESGYLEEVDLLAYDRGVQALADRFGTPNTRAERTAALVREARAAGVHVIACRASLDAMKIGKNRLDPEPDEIVPNGAAKLAELVSRGFQVVRY